MPTKRQFDLVLIMLLLWQPAKGLAKMVLARHAATDDDISGTLAQAGLVVVS